MIEELHVGKQQFKEMMQVMQTGKRGINAVRRSETHWTLQAAFKARTDPAARFTFPLSDPDSDLGLSSCCFL